MATEPTLDDARESLIRIQSFDPESIAREDDLGRLNFTEAVPDAQKIIEIFQRIVPTTLDIFADGQLVTIRDLANSAFNLLDQILQFDPDKAGNAGDVRRNLIAQLRQQPESLRSQLWMHVSYSVASSLDPTATQQQMRAAFQQFSDQQAKAQSEADALKAEIQEVLERVRNAAAEQGVSQQASYFKTIADGHDTESKKWISYTIWLGVGVLAFSFLAAITYRIPWLAPVNTMEAIQLISSKLVILAILGYGLTTCVRVYISNKHNSVINRHRQNALLTYTAFVDAAPSTASREIVLTHAAASVFSPQDTGYVKGEEAVGGKSILEILTKASSLTDQHRA